jgi:hypothetical protein
VHPDVTKTLIIVASCKPVLGYISITMLLPGKYDNRFNSFISLCVKCKQMEIFLSEELLYGLVVHHTCRSYDPGSDCSVPEGLLPHDAF